MKKSKAVKVIKIVAIVFVVIVLVLFTGGFFWIRSMMNNDDEQEQAEGNADIYAVENVEGIQSSLSGKNFLFLGSSVTKGQASQGTSFVEYMEARDGIAATKEAASATTLVDEWSVFGFIGYGDGGSYIKRLKKIDTGNSYDCVVVQLSTNDATTMKPLGNVSDSQNMEDFDVSTVVGAIEYIIAYSKETWDCPVVFYTGSYYENETYAEMVELLYQIQGKWDIGIIDMYTNEEFNNIDEETYNLYMWDAIHPTKAGYLEWWTPYMEECLEEIINQ